MPSSRSGSSRRGFLQKSMAAGVAVTLRPALSAAREMPRPATSPVPEVAPFELDEITIAELQDGMTSGKFTARALLGKHSQRIDETAQRGPALNASSET